jgi:hypothetical protein
MAAVFVRRVAATLSAVVPAKSRDPYRVMSRLKKNRVTASSHNDCGLWLWAPAFAGATGE